MYVWSVCIYYIFIRGIYYIECLARYYDVKSIYKILTSGKLAVSITLGLNAVAVGEWIRENIPASSFFIIIIIIVVVIIIIIIIITTTISISIMNVAGLGVLRNPTCKSFAFRWSCPLHLLLGRTLSHLRCGWYCSASFGKLLFYILFTCCSQSCRYFLILSTVLS